MIRPSLPANAPSRRHLKLGREGVPQADPEGRVRQVSRLRDANSAAPPTGAALASSM
ncbi:MAG: hypothetical protein IT306_06615 [Chloroflexi bacterium]|nr:hypothetical protein [Chloroflexota bacterium]